MAKQTLEKRIQRVILDTASGKKVDPRKRWEKIEEDLPEGAAKVEAAIGLMPDATLDNVPLEIATYYAGRDADATLRVRAALWPRIVSQGLEGTYRMDMAAIPMFERMQANGMLVDLAHFKELGEYMTFRMGEEVAKIDAICGTGPDFNPNSGDQVAPLLFKKLRLPHKRMTKGGKRESTDDKTLESLRSSHRVVPCILDYREFSKVRDSFCTKLPKYVCSDGRVRANLRVTRVSSGRLSATNPNLLAIPVRTELGKEVRAGFIAPPGMVLGSWDLDQIEMRVMADESQDKTMCGLFRRGEDIHTATASWTFGCKQVNVKPIQRYAAKRIGFGVMTGITAMGLKDQMDMAGAEGWDEQTCQEAIDAWFSIYSGAKSYMESCRAEARRYGFVRDRWGRIRYLPGVHSDIPRIKAEAERQSHSHKIQGGAQGIIKHAMAGIWEWMQWWISEAPDAGNIGIEPILQVHDELLFEVADGLQEVVGPDIRDLMQYTTTMRVPIKAKYSFGPNWGVLKN
jgi:DNA polymerase-1